MLGAQHEDVRLYAHALQLFHGVLCRFRFQFAGSREIWYICKVYAKSISAKFPFKLAYALKVRKTLYVAHRSAYLGYDKVIVVLLSQQLYITLYLVRDMRYHLYCLSEIISAPLLVYHRLVYASGCYVVCLGCLYTRKTLVVSEVEVCLMPVHRHITLSMLIRVQRSRIDVDVWVEFLYCDVISPCLKELTY